MLADRTMCALNLLVLIYSTAQVEALKDQMSPD